MNIGEVMLIVALVVTVGHAIMDVALTVQHAAHPKDSLLTVASIIFLVLHVIFTGEAGRWAGALIP